MNNSTISLLLTGCVLASLVACTPASQTPLAQELSRQDSCSEDGMILMDYPGPKAQIVWTDGSRSFYCDLREAIPAWFDSGRKKRIAAFYVQDFGGAEWGTYSGRWIPFEQATLVINSSRRGSMGVTWVPFRDAAMAHTFHTAYGGEMLAATALQREHLERAAAVQQQILNSIQNGTSEPVQQAPAVATDSTTAEHHNHNQGH